MLKIFGTTRCRRCGSTLEHTTEQPDDGSVETFWSPDSKLVCRSCGLSRPVIYAHVRSYHRGA
jgi:hypothetical protein